MSDKHQDNQIPAPQPIGRKGKKDEALWLMSFSDMCLVLMCFFVLIISNSKPKNDEYDFLKKGNSQDEQERIPDIDEVSEELKKVIESKEIQEKAEVITENEEIIIEFKDHVLFQSGSSSFKKTDAQVVNKVLETVAKFQNGFTISVEGHSDDTPMGKGALYRSNWELSGARAFRVLERFSELGIHKERLKAIAHGETDPKVSISSLKGRELTKARSANRRVVIRLSPGGPIKKIKKTK